VIVPPHLTRTQVDIEFDFYQIKPDQGLFDELYKKTIQQANDYLDADYEDIIANIIQQHSAGFPRVEIIVRLTRTVLECVCVILRERLPKFHVTYHCAYDEFHSVFVVDWLKQLDNNVCDLLRNMQRER